MDQRRLDRVLSAVASQPSGSSIRRLCSAATTSLDVAGAGIGLTVREDLLQTVVATDAAQDGERLQSDLGEGPAYTAHRSGWPVLVGDLEHDGTWSAFGPAAVEVGLRAVSSFPLRSGSVRLGALTLYDHQAGDLSNDHHADALVFARLALDLCLALQSGRATDDLAHLFTDDLVNTAHIHQASGIVSVQLGINIGAALALLRGRAYADERALCDVADDVVGRRLRFDGTGADDGG